MIRLNTRNKLLLTLTVLLASSFVGISLLNYIITRNGVHAEIIRNDLPLTMDNIYSELTAEMTKPLLVSSAMASDTFVKDWAAEGEKDLDKITRYLEEIKDRYGFFTAFFISAKTGSYYRYNGIHKTISQDDDHDVWYFNFINSQKEYVFDVDTDEAANNILTIFINYRVLDQDGNLLGVTGVGLQVDTMARRIAEYQQKYNRAVYLTDPRGVFQVHLDTTLIRKKAITDLAGIGELTEKILKTKNTPANFEFERNNHTILLTVRHIASLDWFLYVEQNESEALAVAKNNFIRTVLVGMLVSVIIITLTLLTINQYQKRIEALVLTDELTKTDNRRALAADFNRTRHTYARTRQPFTLLLLDLDGFKRVNDSLGHMAGDQLLIAIVNLLRCTIRPTDTLARWGGDEFAILCSCNAEEAWTLAQRIRTAIENENMAGSAAQDAPGNQITVSCGISSYCEGDELDNMVSRADQAMYNCKTSGGNCVEFGSCVETAAT